MPEAAVYFVCVESTVVCVSVPPCSFFVIAHVLSLQRRVDQAQYKHCPENANRG